MKEQSKVTPYSIEQCDIRIAHWEKKLEELLELHKDLDLEKRKPLLHPTINLIKFWKGYKEHYYGKRNKSKASNRTKS